ncbi:MAG: hypothetical protein IKL82_01715 [Clostridia bacterium]|nr:hypothetical protein [Clostridia bacterium]
MNCIDKMYKEIEEIIRKEKLEYERLAVPVREIKHGFSSDEAFLTEVDPVEPVDYLSQIVLDSEWNKKPLTEERAKEFISFIFKKYLCFNKPSSSAETFFNSLEKLLSEGGDLISVLVKAENDFLDLIGGETEEVINYFTNPYNALFKDENGYFAVIKNGKFTDVKRPFSFNPNQMKKIIKEAFDEYANDFSSKFASEKEKNSFLNSLKADVNKSSEQNATVLEKECLLKFKEVLSKNGVSEKQIDVYVENKGLSLIKVNNFYYRKKAYEEYGEYKKIEFRY